MVFCFDFREKTYVWVRILYIYIQVLLILANNIRQRTFHGGMIHHRYRLMISRTKNSKAWCVGTFGQILLYCCLYSNINSRWCTAAASPSGLAPLPSRLEVWTRAPCTSNNRTYCSLLWYDNLAMVQANISELYTYAYNATEGELPNQSHNPRVEVLNRESASRSAVTVLL